MLPLKEIVEYGVIGVLVLMSIVSLWASFERMLFYRYIKLVLYNNKIELEIKKLYKLQELKKGLMQSMFV